ncbi:MAG: DbpA RNA binding domain-containing protein [Hyphomicrobiaceae bacterium]
MVWFRLNIGRERNADPRWLLPLICKAGGVSKAEVGAIKIFDKDSRFQIAAPIAEQFEAHVRSNSDKEGQITRADRPSHGPRSTSRFERPHRPAPDATDAAPETATPAPATATGEAAGTAEPAPSPAVRERSPDAARPPREFRPQRHHEGKPPRPFGKKPHRKRQRPPPDARGTPPPHHARPAQPHGERSPSKYAQKKKKRAEPATT